jgi:hypothetical protein
LLLDLRQSGANDVIVDIGTYSTYQQAAPGSSFTVPQITLAQLQGIYGSGLNGISFSVAGFADPGITSPTTEPRRTLWMSAPAPDLTTQSSAWPRRSASSQATTGAQLGGVVNVANNVGTPIGGGGNNRQYANSESGGYTGQMSASGNWNNTFPGNVEQTTPATGSFDVRLDLYEITPSTTGGSGNFLGFFEFSNSGLTFNVPGLASVPEPTTYGILAGLGLLAVTLRGQLRNKNASV